MSERFWIRRTLSELGLLLNMFAFVFERTLFFARNILLCLGRALAGWSTDFSRFASLRPRMKRTLYLCRSSKEKVLVDLHIAVLAECMLYLCRSAEEKVTVDLHLVVLAGRNNFRT